MNSSLIVWSCQELKFWKQYFLFTNRSLYFHYRANLDICGYQEFRHWILYNKRAMRNQSRKSPRIFWIPAEMAEELNKIVQKGTFSTLEIVSKTNPHVIISNNSESKALETEKPKTIPIASRLYINLHITSLYKHYRQAEQSEPHEGIMHAFQEIKLNSLDSKRGNDFDFCKDIAEYPNRKKFWFCHLTFCLFHYLE